MDKTFYTEENPIRFPLQNRYKYRGPSELFIEDKRRAKAGSIVLVNQEGDKRIVSLEDYRSAWKDNTEYQPIAVVVIPASHTDDGTVRCMSLKWMKANTPEGSDTPVATRWSDQNVDDPEMPNKTNFAYYVQGTTTVARANPYYVPTNYESWGDDYEITIHSDDPLAPKYKGAACSPAYATDGVSKNPGYYIEGSLGEEMDGKGNTAILIKNNVSTNYAANMCHIYYTPGTQPGDWYLPAIGELAFIPSRGQQIVDTLTELGWDNTKGLNLIDGSNNANNAYIWSSTEYNNNVAWLLRCFTSYVYYGLYKNISYYVLSFVAF